MIKNKLDRIFNKNYEDYKEVTIKIYKNSILKNKQRYYKESYIRTYNEDIIFELLSICYEYILNKLTNGKLDIIILEDENYFRSIVINYINKQCNWNNQKICKIELELTNNNLPIIDNILEKKEDIYYEEPYFEFLEFYKNSISSDLLELSIFEIIIENLCYTGPKISFKTKIGRTYSHKILKEFKLKINESYKQWKLHNNL